MKINKYNIFHRSTLNFENHEEVNDFSKERKKTMMVQFFMLLSVAASLPEKDEVKLTTSTSQDQHPMKGQSEEMMEKSVTLLPSDGNATNSDNSSKFERERAVDEENRKLQKIGKVSYAHEHS